MTVLRKDISGKLAPGLAAALCLTAIAGCSSSGGSAPRLPTTQVVRSSSDTAPTDLQLLCASQAAEQLQVAGGNVLPVSSMRSGGNAYQVNLTFEGGQAVCFIDNNGTVQSINRV